MPMIQLLKIQIFLEKAEAYATKICFLKSITRMKFLMFLLGCEIRLLKTILNIRLK